MDRKRSSLLAKEAGFINSFYHRIIILVFGCGERKLTFGGIVSFANAKTVSMTLLIADVPSSRAFESSREYAYTTVSVNLTSSCWSRPIFISIPIPYFARRPSHNTLPQRIPTAVLALLGPPPHHPNSTQFARCHDCPKGHRNRAAPSSSPSSPLCPIPSAAAESF